MLTPFKLLKVTVSTDAVECHQYFEELPTVDELVETLKYRSADHRSKASLEAVPMTSEHFQAANLVDDLVEVAALSEGVVLGEQIVKAAGRLPVGSISVFVMEGFRRN